MHECCRVELGQQSDPGRDEPSRGRCYTPAMLAELSVSELLADPVAGYTLLAALLLATASVAAGVARLDFLVLARPVPALALVVCLLVALAFRALIGPDPLATAPVTWAPAGIERLPLYLAALAYGPTVGLLAGGGFTLLLLVTTGEAPGWAQALLTLELLLLGWLAIFPSPRQFRWAAAFNVLLASSLTWLTGGIALARLLHGELTAENVLVINPLPFTSLTTSAAVLLLIPRSAYRVLFRGTRIAPEGYEDEGGISDGPNGPLPQAG